MVCVLPQVEEIAGDDRAKRWRIPKSTANGLIDISIEELAAEKELGVGKYDALDKLTV